jgi:hypothetical protein
MKCCGIVLFVLICLIQTGLYAQNHAPKPVVAVLPIQVLIDTTGQNMGELPMETLRQQATNHGYTLQYMVDELMAEAARFPTCPYAVRSMLMVNRELKAAALEADTAALNPVQAGNTLGVPYALGGLLNLGPKSFTLRLGWYACPGGTGASYYEYNRKLGYGSDKTRKLNDHLLMASASMCKKIKKDLVRSISVVRHL